MTTWQIVAYCVLAWWMLNIAAIPLCRRWGRRRDARLTAMRRHPSAQHPDGDCDDNTCCVSIDQAAAMADAEEMRVQDGELDDAELFRLVDEWSGR